MGALVRESDAWQKVDNCFPLVGTFIGQIAQPRRLVLTDLATARD